MTAYKHIGGSIAYRGRFLTDQEVAEQLAMAQREVIAAQSICDEINAARKQQERWARCGEVREIG